MDDSEIAALRAEVAQLRDEAARASAREDRLAADLRASQAMHEATIESLPFDFWARDREGYCVSENSAARRNWGGLLGRRPEDLDLPAEVIAGWLDNNRRAMSGEIVHGDVDYVVGGEVRHIHNILAPIRQGDETLGTLGVNLDLTELRRAERRVRETQRLETVGLLAGGVAHDINNIVMVILGATSMARRRVTPSSALADDLATIEVASRRAAAICSQLLAFAGKGDLARELLDLQALVIDTAMLLKSALPHAVELGAPNGRSLAVEVDATQVRQLVTNLILNASEAIGDRAGTITVTAAPADPAIIAAHAATELGVALDPSCAYAMLEVVDTGCGMTPETTARIFEPFFTTKARGRGLGLAAALGTVRAHRGALQVDTTPGRGSTFRVFLPRSSRTLDESAPARPIEDWHGAGTALIVDDDAGVASTAARMTREIGFAPVIAASGHEALDRLRDVSPVAFVLLDLMMPGLDGRATLARIRDLHPALPVVLMSGFSDLADPPSHVPLLRKPFTLDELAGIVRAAVGATR